MSAQALERLNRGGAERQRIAGESLQVHQRLRCGRISAVPSRRSGDRTGSVGVKHRKMIGKRRRNELAKFYRLAYFQGVSNAGQLINKGIDRYVRNEIASPACVGDKHG